MENQRSDLSTTECQVYCIVEAQRGKAGQINTKKRLRKRETHTLAVKTLLPLGDYVTRFSDVSDSPDKFVSSE